MWLALALPIASADGDAADLPALEWDWSKTHKYYLETEVHLPYLMWWVKQFNEQARVNAFQVRIVTTCGPASVAERRSSLVACRLDDVGLSGSALPGDEGLLQPILDELDERLTGSTVDLQFRDDGRIVNLGMVDLDRRNQRVGAMNENLRLVVLRAFAGLDAKLGRPGVSQWVQSDSRLFHAPEDTGTSGIATLVYQVRGVEGPIVDIESFGEAIIVPNDSGNQYEARLASELTFDTRRGGILDREWSVIAYPTPSSRIADGWAGYPYAQFGRAVALGPEQTMDVGASVEMAPPGTSPSSLQQWHSLGSIPR